MTGMDKINKAIEMVSLLCLPDSSEGSRRWIMSIPARPDHDPDIIISEGLKIGKENAEILNWLQDHQGYALVSDDGGHWACVCDGVQSVPEKFPDDIHAVFWIEKHKWKNSISEAIQEAMRDQCK